MYSIKEMSDKFNLPSSALRYYEEIGLLENVEHKNGYHRIYDESHVDRLNDIECFKKARLPLKEIKLFCNYSAPKIPGIMQEFQQRQVLQLQRRLFHVFLLSRYKNGF